MTWKVIGLKYTALGYIQITVEEESKTARMVVLDWTHRELALGDLIEIDIRKVGP